MVFVGEDNHRILNEAGDHAVPSCAMPISLSGGSEPDLGGLPADGVGVRGRCPERSRGPDRPS